MFAALLPLEWLVPIFGNVTSHKKLSLANLGLILFFLMGVMVAGFAVLPGNMLSVHGVTFFME